MKAEVPPDKKWKRELESLALIPMDDRWFWKAEFVWMPLEGGIGGRPPDYTVVILMDGTVVPGKVDKDDN